MKNILGLDLGTNSVGWALVSYDEETQVTPSVHLGSRIIPMSQDVLDKFGVGVTESQAAVRTQYRGMRRMNERYLLRRERLFRILHILGFLPQHFDQAIGWDRENNRTFGKFIDGEPKLAYIPTGNKPQFLFRMSFEEMLADFAKHHPALVADKRKLPYDWTQYYLRKKALTQPISKYELAWIILRFNQKRGYNQLRGEEQETEVKRREYAILTIVNVEETAERRAGNPIYRITYSNGMVQERASRISLMDRIGKEVECIITTDLDKNGQPKVNKEGNVKYSITAPDSNDWNLKKKRTETSIEESGKTVGQYIYDALLANPKARINGGVVQTIERKYYKNELWEILTKQAEFIPELKDNTLLEACLADLYASNVNRRNSLRERGLLHLIIEDALFYQRPLKTKKSEIADCPHERRQSVDQETGEIKSHPIKCIAKSNPYFQEFRLWQFVWNLRLYNNTTDENVTDTYLPTPESRQDLFRWLNNREAVKQEELLAYFGIKKPRGKDAVLPIRWNYVTDKQYPCNETRGSILKYLKKAKVDAGLIDDFATLQHLWHILYSVEVSAEAIKALTSFATKHKLPTEFVKVFASYPPISKDYGAFSEKAIKRLLPLLCEGVQLWQAEEMIYGKKTNTDRWNSPEEMKAYIDRFKVGSLRNPIVEQCIMESLRTVRDIWQQYGHIDEIHVELGREMKNPADKRRKMTDRIQENENTNMRIRTMLAEFKRESMLGVRPNSPMQQVILRIYEEGALQTLNKDDKDFKDIYRISHLATPTSAEITRYKLWLEQRYRSPYTGAVIPLSRLFTEEYEIEHIIPRSRFFDDSFNNKVICEAEVNRLKSNKLAMEFIREHGGSIVQTAHGSVQVLKEDAYLLFVDAFYRGNKRKAAQLKLDDIPEEFVQRQMNDSRYISRVVKSILSYVVRDAEDDTAETSRNIIVTSGGVTDKLKKDWGLNDVWNTLVYPRFERMNDLTGTTAFGQWENKAGHRVFQTNMPLELSAGFRKKRIDHRHHAMDALVVACASRNIINYLNNESARDTGRREDLKRKLTVDGKMLRKPWPTFTQDTLHALCRVVVTFKNTVRILSSTVNIYEHYDENGKKSRRRQEGNNVAVRKPLHKETFYGRVNLRRKKVEGINAALKHPDDICDREIRAFIKAFYAGKFTEKQIRAALKECDYKYDGKDISKIEVFYMTDDVEPLVASRELLDDTFNETKIAEITDTAIQRILINYLRDMGGDPKVAFSPDGIARMNENIAQYNNRRAHKPIIKVRTSKTLGEKFAVGTTGAKDKKYVVAQGGTNLFFGIYLTEDGTRKYTTPSLREVIERKKQGLSPVPEQLEDGSRLLFTLSPNDLVYVPSVEEQEVPITPQDLSVDRIYKFVDASQGRANFVPHYVASLIYKVPKADAHKYSGKEIVQNEFGVGSPKSKNERSLDGQMVKNVCWKLVTDRLGNIVQIIR